MTDRLTDETFFAWLDGELAGAEAEAVAAMVAADPFLSARAAEHRALAGRLRAAFDPIAAARVPERLARPLARSPRRVAGPRFAGVPQWAAMAASLALGLFVGTLVAGGADGPVDMREGAIYADGSLESALNRQLASAPAGGDIRIGLTFRDGSGAICRSFSGPASSGLACRDPAGWRLRGLFAPPEGQSGDYRMAAGPDPNLTDLVEATIAGEPFDARQEKQARERGWR